MRIAEAGERIDVACDACHEMYQIAAGDPDNYKKVLGTYKLTAEEKAPAACGGSSSEGTGSEGTGSAKTATAPAAPPKK